MIIDSCLTSAEALAQNPNMPAPLEVLNTLELLEVKYRGFDTELHMGQIVVARELVKDVETFFSAAYEQGFPFQGVIPAASFKWEDAILMSWNITSGFNYREIAGTENLSLHALGRAFDVNPRQNPYVRFRDREMKVSPAGAIWDERVPGTLHASHDLVFLMRDLGWEWGGDWTASSGRIDYQHFQKPVQT